MEEDEEEGNGITERVTDRGADSTLKERRRLLNH